MFFKAMLAFLTNSTFCRQNCGRINCVTILMHELSTSSASPSRKKEDEEEMTLSWGQKVFSKQEFRSMSLRSSNYWISQNYLILQFLDIWANPGNMSTTIQYPRNMSSMIQYLGNMRMPRRRTLKPQWRRSLCVTPRNFLLTAMFQRTSNQRMYLF